MATYSEGKRTLLSRKESRGDSLKITFGKVAGVQPVFMTPAIFIGSTTLIGLLFGLQQWVGMHLWSYHIGISILLEAWGLQYFLWGVLCWFVWWWLGAQIQSSRWTWMITRLLPLSIATSVAEEMMWVLVFPNLPLRHAPMDYWHRLAYQLNAEFIDSLLLFWCAIALFRGVGYYQRYREKENAAAQLEVQLAHAQISALRMQLNPHFLFNTMNSISSLMRTDIDGADTMLEQLGSLMRITLERGDAQLIPLRDEMEFIEMYMAMQEKRYGSRVQQSVSVDPELYDALVPAMILQPIVENAYTHGLSKLNCGGTLAIAVRKEEGQVKFSVVNSGIGMRADPWRRSPGQGVGLANIKSRLQLHYGVDHTLAIREGERNKVQVTMTIPLNLSKDTAEEFTRFGA